MLFYDPRIPEKCRERRTGGRRWLSYADKWLETRQDVSRYVLFKLDDSWSAERTRYPSLQFQRPFSPNLTIGHIPQPLLVISIQIPPLIFCRILRGNLQIPTVHQMQFSSELSRQDPILFYAGVPLSEDELHDNRASSTRPSRNNCNNLFLFSVLFHKLIYD